MRKKLLVSHKGAGSFSVTVTKRYFLSFPDIFSNREFLFAIENYPVVRETGYLFHIDDYSSMALLKIRR